MAEIYSREFIQEFIEIYKQQTCLWKIKDKNYRNKIARDAAYKVLVDYSKKFYPYANKDFVSRKIQSLRSSFRKEIVKYMNFRRQGNTADTKYEPSLWYFHLLMFTKEQDTVSSDRSDSENSERNGENGNGRNWKKDDYTIEISENSDTSSSQSEPNLPKRKRKKTIAVSKPILPPPPPQKKMQFEVMVSEFDSVGINVAAKLKRMDPQQATHAELLINKVLALGLLRRLTPSTDVAVVSKKLYDDGDDINLHREVNLSD